MRRLLAILFGAAVLVVSAPSTSVAADCSSSGFSCAGGGYSASPSTWAETYYGWTAAQTLGWVGFDGHNCTRYAAYRLAKNGVADPRRSYGMASQWNENVSAIYGASKVNATPAVGSIAQWEAAPWNGNSGHVAYVESVGATEITITEDSWGGGTSRRNVSRSGTGHPDSYLHIKDVPQGTTSNTSSGQVAVRSDGLAVFFRGTDGRLWNAWHTSTGWHVAGIGGSVASGSGVSVRSDGMAVFFRGTDGRLWNAWHTSTGWHVAGIGGSVASGSGVSVRSDG
ncbi:CHAP domain-containing protein, partial [Phycicoccus flavus]